MKGRHFTHHEEIVQNHEGNHNIPDQTTRRRRKKNARFPLELTLQEVRDITLLVVELKTVGTFRHHAASVDLAQELLDGIHHRGFRGGQAPARLALISQGRHEVPRAVQHRHAAPSVVPVAVAQISARMARKICPVRRARHGRGACRPSRHHSVYPTAYRAPQTRRRAERAVLNVSVVNVCALAQCAGVRRCSRRRPRMDMRSVRAWFCE
jgi:hypothetical protein